MKINEHLLDKIQHVANLPTLPQVASRLIQIINDPLTSATDVACIIGQDLSLSAKVLRLANSAFYGIPRSITNINNAVVILGIKVINTMVLSLTVFDLFPNDKGEKSTFDKKKFWIHSLSCGLISKFIAQRTKKLILFDPEEAFCAGLLHDIGKVVMEQYLHNDFHEALNVSQNEKIPNFEAESKVLKFTHADVAGWLTRSWNLPFDIQLPMIHHHNPSETQQCKEIVSLCHLADILCYETGKSIDQKYPAPTMVPETIDLLKLTQNDIDEVKKLLPEELDKLAILFEIAEKR